MIVDPSHEPNSLSSKVVPVHAVKKYVVVEVGPHKFLTSAQDCGEWSVTNLLFAGIEPSVLNE